MAINYAIYWGLTSGVVKEGQMGPSATEFQATLNHDILIVEIDKTRKTNVN